MGQIARQLLTVAFVALLSISPALGQKGASVTVVNQSGLYLGPSTLYLDSGQDRAKLVCHDGKLAVFCGPPQWNVLIFRSEENEGFPIALHQWATKGFGVMRSKTSLRDGTRSNVFDSNLKVDCIQIVTKPGGRYYEGNDPVMFRATTKSTVTRAVFKMTPSVHLTEHLMSFVRGLYDQPSIECFPLELSTALSDGSVIKTFSTQSIGKGTVPAGFWTYPKNFKVVSTKADIMATEKDMKKFGDILKGYMED